MGLLGHTRAKFFVLIEERMEAAETAGETIPGDIGKRQPIDDLGKRLLGDRACYHVVDGAGQDFAMRGPEFLDRQRFVFGVGGRHV